MTKKILILSASAGAGHVRAAAAIEKAFALEPNDYQVEHIDVLNYTSKLFQKLYSKVYLDLVNRTPELFGWLYDKTDTPWENEKRRLAFNKLNSRPFIKMVEAYQPDMIVCTHFLPAEIVSWLRAQERLTCPQVIVVTDMDAHAMWLCRHYEHYFVAMEETRVLLTSVGIDPGKITISGIPIDPIFAQPKDSRQMRLKHGLDPDRTTILVSAGGWGVGPLDQLIEVLTTLRHQAQLVVICGRNEELKARLDGLAQTLRDKAVRIKPMGYTTEMDEYMSAADLLVGKPGGLTTAEALAKGLIMVIVNPIQGQEERNSDHLLEEGVAIRCNNLATMAYKIDRLLEDTARLAVMRDNLARLARPHAADTIVKKVISLLSE